MQDHLRTAKTPTTPNEKLVEGDVDAELQGLLHGNLFTRIGISIASGGGGYHDGRGNRASNDVLTVELTNATLFEDFLKTIDAQDVTEVNGELLVNIAYGLKARISQCFGSEELARLSEVERQQVLDTGEDALRTYTILEEEYARLGFGAATLKDRVEDVSPQLKEFLESEAGEGVPREVAAEYRAREKTKSTLATFSSLEQYVKYWGQGVLPEFTVAEANQYTYPIDQQMFGPARWAEDMSSDQLKERWETAVDFLEGLEGKLGAEELRDQVQSNLRRSLECSRVRMLAGERASAEHFEEELAEWEAHGERPYETTWGPNSTIVRTVDRAPTPPTYHKNNRLILETVDLRLNGREE